MEGDGRTFRANFTNEGVAKLREQITEKLKEFMGDYTDDTLVEYVIVLLKNGRSKDEAKSELDVFLGDDSDSFVTWLWAHLGSYLSLYVQPREARQDGVTKTKAAAREPAGRTESRQDGETKTKHAAGEPAGRTESHRDGATKTKSAAGEPAGRTESRQDGATKTKPVAGEPAGRTKAHQIESDAEKKPSRNHRSREWKGIVRDVDENEVHLPQSSVSVRVNDQDDPPPLRVGHSKRLLSPWRTNQKKRGPDEQQPRKRDISRITVGGARRLLQFAVRDAVRPADTSTEPSSKRLRSVVATATGDSFPEERPIRNRLSAGSHTDMSAAIKAAAEAVNDVNRLRPPHSIFDRLGQASDVHNIINNEDDFINNEDDYIGFHDDGVGDYIDEREDVTFHEIILPQDVIMSHGDTIMASDLGYDDERYDGIDSRGQGSLGTSGGDWVDDSLVFPADEAHDFDDRTQRPHIDLDQQSTAYHSSAKFASSVNIDMWRTPHYDNERKLHVMDHGKLIQDSDTVAIKLEPRLMKEHNNHIIAFNENAKPHHESQKTRAPTGSYSADPPTEDADSRTIYVSNVHFAATKDSLMRHFNKFGDVLKVIILTDPTTGLPKGSAYIEFMRKEAAENAFLLNGTSFMSRILKVVWKSSAQPEAAPVVSWPRAAASSPFPVPRFSRSPFARGIPRPRIPIKPTRSFQWKRGGTEIPDQVFPQPPITRSLTYVRTKAKANGNSGASA